MRTLTGPGLVFAQFAQDTPPHNSLPTIAGSAKDYGYTGIRGCRLRQSEGTSRPHRESDKRP